jgi:hypothetical protein
VPFQCAGERPALPHAKRESRDDSIGRMERDVREPLAGEPGEVLYSSSRHFQLWRYSTSHSELYVRSNKGRGESTRVDVLFKPVAHMDLPAFFEGLTIEMGQVVGPHDRRRFVLKGDGWVGSVDAMVVFLAETELDYNEPSPFEFPPSPWWRQFLWVLWGKRPWGIRVYRWRVQRRLRRHAADRD